VQFCLSGAQCPQRGRVGRVQQLGWAPPSDAVPGGGQLGAVHSWPEARPDLQI
jgi:hypothetical protein